MYRATNVMNRGTVQPRSEGKCGESGTRTDEGIRLRLSVCMSIIYDIII